MNATQWELVALASGCTLAGIAMGALAHQRKEKHTPAQGAVRACVVLFFLAVAVSATGAVLGWDLAVRATPPILMAWIALGAMLWDMRNEIRTRPTTGPLRHVTRTGRWYAALRRRQRRRRNV